MFTEVDGAEGANSSTPQTEEGNKSSDSTSAITFTSFASTTLYNTNTSNTQPPVTVTGNLTTHSLMTSSNSSPSTTSKTPKPTTTAATSSIALTKNTTKDETIPGHITVTSNASYSPATLPTSSNDATDIEILLYSLAGAIAMFCTLVGVVALLKRIFNKAGKYKLVRLFLYNKISSFNVKVIRFTNQLNIS